MVAKNGLIKILLLGIALFAAGNGYAQDELRKTFFKDADAAKAAADAVNAKLYAPKSYQNGMKEYQDAESLLERGRNIEYVREMQLTQHVFHDSRRSRRARPDRPCSGDKESPGRC